MKIYVYPADQTGCGYYRAIWPAKTLRAAGHDIVVIHPDDAKNDLKVEVQRDEIKSIQFPHDADVIVLQRPLHVWIAKTIPLLRQAGVAVVVDIDDDLESMNPKHPAFSVLNPRYNRTYNWNVTREACRAATWVTVSTEPLRRVYSPLTGNCTVIKNTVPEAFLTIKPSNEQQGQVIGWMGSVHSHPDDLQVMGASPARLQREGFPWKFVGPDRGIMNALHFDTEPFATGHMPIEDIPRAMVDTMGIGVAPLQDTRFNRAKSWLKPLEYAALGIPCVTSNLPEYRSFATHSGHLLAQRPKDWYRHLKKLALDDEFYHSQSLRARRGASMFTIEEHAGEWLEAWLNAWRIDSHKRSVTV